LPSDVIYGEVVGHGLNADELAANPQLTRYFVQDLNTDPRLPLADQSKDAAGCCVSVQYLQAPVDVFREVRRVLNERAPFAVTFSNRCFPTKAVAIWQALTGDDQAKLVALYMERAGFTSVEIQSLARPDYGGDPLWAVVGRAPPREA